MYGDTTDVIPAFFDLSGVQTAPDAKAEAFGLCAQVGGEAGGPGRGVEDGRDTVSGALDDASP